MEKWYIHTLFNVMALLLILGILYIFNIKTQVQRRAITLKSVCIYHILKEKLILHIKTVLYVMDFLLILGILYIFNIKTQVQRRAITFKSVCIYHIQYYIGL